MPKREPSPAPFTPAPLPVAPLTPAQRLACLRLVRTDGIGPTLFRDLINHYGGAEPALEALPELARRGGGSRPLRICPFARAEFELETAARTGATPVFTIEPGYPPHLAQIEAPPPMLYVKGRINLLQRPAISIVGSRAASAAGHKIAGLFARELGRAGFVIASGLARGIDAAAHEAALTTGTIAVLAGGIDFVYPPEHAALQRQIGEAGCLLTEMPPGFQPRAKDFPRRNRLIAGLALGVVVVEAARRSGTLVTARFAAEQGREVFAVPGHPLDPRAEGTNGLLKNGATLVTEPADVLEALAPSTGFAGGLAQGEALPARPAAVRAPGRQPLPPPALNDGERERVLAALGPAPVDVDALQRASGVAMRALQVILLEFQLAGRVERQGGLVSLRPEA